MESRGAPAMAKRLWNMVRVVYYMLRKGVSKRKLMMDLHLLLKRGKLAGKALGSLITFNHRNAAAFSRRSNTPFYDSKEVEFSCSNTPSYANYFTAKRKNRRHNRRDYYDSYHVEAIAKAFEILNGGEASDAELAASSAFPTPSPMLGFGRSPMVPQLRVTDSPFPIQEEEEETVDAGRIDKEADEFIKRFYEQLRRQHLA